jgi:hypothetical protein
MKVFSYKQINLPDITRISSNGQRYYKTPSGKIYPSVSSVSSFDSRDDIAEWKERVGEKNAQIISEKASSRGTRIHSLCEDFLNNNDVTPDEEDIAVWNSIVPILCKIDNIYGLELPLYSDVLEVAGTADCIAYYDGKLSVIDFKTSRKPKRLEWIYGYIYQCVMYAVSFMELTGLYIGQIVIIVGVDNNEPQVFVEKVDDWINRVIKCRDRYHKFYNK